MNPILSPILSQVDQVYVINLPHRSDRRAEIEAQLRKAGSGLDAANVTLFPALRPQEAGPFPSIGARGCFLSHLGVLRAAHAAGHGQILVLEDDADFAPPFLETAAAARLMAGDWDMVWLGHKIIEPLGHPAAECFALAPGHTLQTSHAILCRRAAIAALIPYLEAILQRPPGDPQGGPMHVDGAYNWFRRAHPEIKALATARQWAVQRASRTDIAETGWKDRLPFVTLLRRIRNRLRG
ncbi:glycosyltransferase family 25 protein [Stagnihabitans tardus]|uniref:LPS biosynthesis glycosyltransferase n=1 Tax=Stagnihabitans tardus TaxID=2699202 RepID=A0AAE5BXT0_9RHOB|nr:glycosyltransferase family 25 protein [Stagnihabitans tardus]NBZ89673.1 LPS biosynthesis glycosyltransferase [Stagnihabitans tardus]